MAYHIGRLALSVAMVAAAAACSSAPELTEAQAREGVETRIHATAAELFPGTRIEESGKITVPCEGWVSEDYRLEHSYRVPGYRPARDNAKLIAAARDLWRAQDYEIAYERTGSRQRLSDVGAADSDGFSMRLWRNDRGDLWLHAISPCLTRPPLAPSTPTLRSGSPGALAGKPH